MPTTTQSPAVRRASAQQQTTADQQALDRVRRPPDEYDDDWPPRQPTSTRRYQVLPPQPVVAQRSGRGLFFLLMPVLCICIGACLAVIVPPALQQWRDNNMYGFPRTSQVNAAVGHGDPHSPTSHFVAMNLGGVLEVIEIPGGDPATYPPKLYRLATLSGSGADLVVVTVAFADINGDGKPDLIASYGGTETILFNNGKGFVPRL